MTLYDPQGSFDDGSGDLALRPAALCSWLIQPANAEQIVVSFDSLNLGTYARVVVYDGNSTAAPKLIDYNGNLIPPVRVSTGPSVLVTLNSDYGGNGIIRHHMCLICVCVCVCVCTCVSRVYMRMCMRECVLEKNVR